MRIHPVVFAALLAALPTQAVACLTQGGSSASGWKAPRPLVPYHAMIAPTGAVVYGVVRTTAGRPVVGAEVTARPLSANGLGDRAITDRYGRYALLHLVPSAIALIVRAPGMSAIGPLPFRVPQDEGKSPFPQRFDIGGMGPAVPGLRPPRSSRSLAGRLIHLPATTRTLLSDGRGGIEALELAGLATVSPHGARASIGFGQLTLAASWQPGSERRLYAVSGLAGTGELTAYGSSGRRIWCRSLPFAPTDVGAAPDGTVYVAGAHDGIGVMAVVRPDGLITRSLALSPGSALRVAVDRSGNAWVSDHFDGLVCLDPRGTVKARLYLPEPPDVVYPTEDGGLWAVGGGVATRLDSHWRPIARIVRPQPIGLSAVDPRGSLWILENGKLLDFGSRGARAYEFSGMPISGAASLAVDRHRHLWLLGLDRQRVAVAVLPR